MVLVLDKETYIPVALVRNKKKTLYGNMTVTWMQKCVAKAAQEARLRSSSCPGEALQEAETMRKHPPGRMQKELDYADATT